MRWTTILKIDKSVNNTDYRILMQTLYEELKKWFEAEGVKKFLMSNAGLQPNQLEMRSKYLELPRNYTIKIEHEELGKQETTVLIDFKYADDAKTLKDSPTSIIKRFEFIKGDRELSNFIRLALEEINLLGIVYSKNVIDADDGSDVSTT